MIDLKTGQPFPRGARPTPQHKLQAALMSGRLKLHRPLFTPPPRFAMIPKKMSYWLNNQYGDCVSAEEAFAVAAYSTLCGSEYFIEDATVKAFASKHDLLDGADLLDVIQLMEKDGFHQGGDVITDGASSVVDYSDEAALQTALCVGPVKLGMDANALPKGAGNQQGWTAFGGRPRQYSNEDHCTGLSAYGETQWLADQLNAVLGANVKLPSNAPKNGYLFYTWSTLGIVDHAWIMSTVGEAFLRTPTTLINGKPLTPPAPTPPVPPAPAVTLALASQWVSDGIDHAAGWLDMLTRDAAKSAALGALAASWPKPPASGDCGCK